MGTILGNPYEFNFAQVANAETVEKRVETYTSGDTRWDVVDSISTSCNSLMNYTVYIMKITTISTNAVKYRVEYTKNGKNPIDSNEVFSTGGDFTSLSDAQKERTDFVDEMNVARQEDGCKDSKALNYSPASAGSDCPCSTTVPVWTQGVKPADGNPSLQTVAEKAGDCSCLMPPEDLDGHGYLVEKWTYVGTPYPVEYDPNPPHYQLKDQWKWQRDTGKSVLPQAGEEDTIYAIAKKGWRATGLNSPQEFIVKTTLAPDSWKKFRLITATGFEKMGCMDSTAKNYDPEAQVGFTKPDTSAENCGTTLDSPLRIACDKQFELWEKYGCKYCEDEDENSSGIDPDTGECKCKDGYKKGFLGKCKKDKKSSGSSDTPPRTPPQGGLILGGIVALTAVGLLTAATMGQKNQTGEM